MSETEQEKPAEGQSALDAVIRRIQSIKWHEPPSATVSDALWMVIITGWLIVFTITAVVKGFNLATI